MAEIYDFGHRGYYNIWLHLFIPLCRKIPLPKTAEGFQKLRFVPTVSAAKFAEKQEAIAGHATPPTIFLRKSPF